MPDTPGFLRRLLARYGLPRVIRTLGLVVVLGAEFLLILWYGPEISYETVLWLSRALVVGGITLGYGAGLQAAGVGRPAGSADGPD